MYRLIIVKIQYSSFFGLHQCSQSVSILPSRDIWQFADIFGCNYWGCYWCLIETRDAVKHPTIHRTDSRTPQQRIVWSKMSIMPRLRNPGLHKINVFAFFSLPAPPLPICTQLAQILQAFSEGTECFWCHQLLGLQISIKDRGLENKKSTECRWILSRHLKGQMGSNFSRKRFKVFPPYEWLFTCFPKIECYCLLKVVIHSLWKNIHSQLLKESLDLLNVLLWVISHSYCHNESGACCY